MKRVKNEKGDRSLPEINYHVAYEKKLQTVNFRTKVRHFLGIRKRVEPKRDRQVNRRERIHGFQGVEAQSKQAGRLLLAIGSRDGG
jgi:hypothetical protein